MMKCHRLSIVGIFFYLLLFQSTTYGQGAKASFVGKLTYKITICDTALERFIPIRYMTVYTNDTLIRIENETDRLGKQIVIKHLFLNKSYLLVNTPTGKYAIQANHNEDNKDSLRMSYTFQKKCGSKTFCNIKAHKALVRHKDFTRPLVFYYFKKYNPKYLNNFENCPGLPVLYYIPTDDGMLKYELISLNSEVPEHDLFGVPSDFKRVTFDQFIEEMMSSQEDPN